MSEKIVAIQNSLAKKLEEKYNDPVLSNQYSWWILEAITEMNKEQLIAGTIEDLTDQQLDTIDDWFDKLFNKNMPLQYLLGSVPFLDLELFVESPTLIPRPETEEMVANLLGQLQNLKNKKIKILDIGTGSGCIALSLAYGLPEATVVGVDISERAVALSKKNKTRNKITNVSFLVSDLFAALEKQTFDLIISNPPYIAEDEWSDLDYSVTLWEDRQALIADKQGTAIIEKIIQDAPKFLHINKEMEEKNIPQLIFEIGYKQGVVVKNLFEKANYSAITIKKDLEGKDRIVTGRVKDVAVRSKKNKRVTIALTPQALSLAVIKSENKPNIVAYHRIPLNHLQFAQSILFNPTAIKYEIKKFYTDHQIVERSAALSVSGPTVFTDIVQKKTASPTKNDFATEHLKNYNWNSLYLCPSQKSGFDFFVTGLKPEHIFSYQLLGFTCNIQLSTIIPEQLSNLYLYKFLNKNSFRQTKLSEDLCAQKYNMLQLCNSEIVESSFNFSPETEIDFKKEERFLKTHLGLFAAERNT